MEYRIFPLEGVGDFIKFGMKRKDVRATMGGEFQTFSRGGEWGTGIPVDFYENDGIFFYYNEHDGLDAVEFSRESGVKIAGMKIFSMKAKDVIRYMFSMDKETRETNDGATSRKLSLGLWSPDLDEDPDAPVESFLTGRPGYYDMAFE